LHSGLSVDERGGGRDGRELGGGCYAVGRRGRNGDVYVGTIKKKKNVV